MVGYKFQVRPQDIANYSCVAENMVNRRVSTPARLEIVGEIIKKMIRIKKSDVVIWSFPFFSCKLSLTFNSNSTAAFEETTPAFARYLASVVNMLVGKNLFGCKVCIVLV